jgi:hypothetical protein
MTNHFDDDVETKDEIEAWRRKEPYNPRKDEKAPRAVWFDFLLIVIVVGCIFFIFI